MINIKYSKERRKAMEKLLFMIGFFMILVVVAIVIGMKID